MRLKITEDYMTPDKELTPKERDDFTEEQLENTYEMIGILLKEYDNPDTQEKYQKIKEAREIIKEFDQNINWVEKENE